MTTLHTATIRQMAAEAKYGMPEEKAVIQIPGQQAARRRRARLAMPCAGTHDSPCSPPAAWREIKPLHAGVEQLEPTASNAAPQASVVHTGSP